jgi:hypothetical protein
VSNDMTVASNKASLALRDKALKKIVEAAWLIKRYPDDAIVHAVYSKKKGIVAIVGSDESEVMAVYGALTDGKTPIRGRVIENLSDKDFATLLKHKDILLPLLPERTHV